MNDYPYFNFLILINISNKDALIPTWFFNSLNFKLNNLSISFIEIYLIKNVVSVSAVQQSDSVIQQTFFF